MSFDTPAKVKEICQKYNFQPSKRRGQNFIIDKNIINKIIAESGVEKDDYVLEIGPGLGVLTDALSPKSKKVLSIEIDNKIVKILRNEFKWPNVEILHEDILRVNNKEITRHLNKKYLLIANLPYQITSSILEKFLSRESRPHKMVIMVQREVGERMLATPPHMNLLALLVQFYGEAKILFRISKNSFWPVPKVDSVMMEIMPKVRLPFVGKVQERFWLTVKSGYRAKRKYLMSNLSNYTELSKEKVKKIFKELGWDVKIRAENLSLEDWVMFFEKAK
jgi:16S rRNA (adenine1518-N6/adenine1519-N6)-dimethyltransferase